MNNFIESPTHEQETLYPAGMTVITTERATSNDLK